MNKLRLWAAYLFLAVVGGVAGQQSLEAANLRLSDLGSGGTLSSSTDKLVTVRNGGGVANPDVLTTVACSSLSNAAASCSTDTTTTANITDSSNKRFMTDAQRTVLASTSGVNTGDQVVPANTTATASNFFTAYASTTGVFTKAQPACSTLSDSTAFCSATGTQATAALNTFSSTLKGLAPASGGSTTQVLLASGSFGNLPTPSTSVLGGVNSFASSSNTFLMGLNTNGTFISGTPSGAGTVTTTGSPANGNLTQFSGATSITNGDLSGDGTTSGTLALTVTKTNGVAFVSSATTDTTNASNISSGSLALGRIALISTNSLLGNVSGSSAAPIALTSAQSTTLCNTFSSTLKGCVPASGGSSSVFLNGGGTFTAPSAGSGGGMFTYSDNGITLSSTVYTPIGGGGLPNTTEASVDVSSPSATTVTNLQVGLSAAPGVGNSVAITLRVGLAGTTLTCTISGAVATTCSDLTHSVNVAQNDLLDWQVVPTGTIVSTPTITIAANNGTSNVGVTSVATGTGLTGGTITTTGTISMATNTANSLAGFNSAGTFSSVAVGTNLTLSGGTLTATGGGLTQDFQYFSSGGTWTPVATPKMIEVIAIGAGGSGGTGLRSANGSERNGGTGGAGGFVNICWFSGGAFASATITVGTGGPAKTQGSDSAATAGSAGGDTFFSGSTNANSACAAHGGSGGTAGASGAGPAAIAAVNAGVPSGGYVAAYYNGGSGGGGGSSGTGGGAAVTTSAGGPGGGGGGAHISAANSDSSGGATNRGSAGGATDVALGTASVSVGSNGGAQPTASTAGASGGNGTTVVPAANNNTWYGSGGGGGNSNDTGTGGSGGDGGAPGGGGGGGGASVAGSPNSSGKGANGGVIVIGYY